jgi:hypothetical protein
LKYVKWKPSKKTAVKIAVQVTTGTSRYFSKLQLQLPPVAVLADNRIIFTATTIIIIIINTTSQTTWTSYWAIPIFTIQVRCHIHFPIFVFKFGYSSYFDLFLNISGGDLLELDVQSCCTVDFPLSPKQLLLGGGGGGGGSSNSRSSSSSSSSSSSNSSSNSNSSCCPEDGQLIASAGLLSSPPSTPSPSSSNGGGSTRQLQQQQQPLPQPPQPCSVSDKVRTAHHVPFESEREKYKKGNATS